MTVDLEVNRLLERIRFMSTATKSVIDKSICGLFSFVVHFHLMFTRVYFRLSCVSAFEFGVQIAVLGSKYGPEFHKMRRPGRLHMKRTWNVCLCSCTSTSTSACLISWVHKLHTLYRLYPTQPQLQIDLELETQLAF